MATVTEMKNLFLSFLDHVDEIAKEIIDTNESDLTDLVKEQLRQGKDGNDEYIQPEYRDPEYSKMKFGFSGSQAPYGIPDLHLTGSFYNLMAITWFDKDEFSIISNDKKWFDLMKKYGLDTLKMSQTSIQYFKINRFDPAFIQAFSNYTGAKIT